MLGLADWPPWTTAATPKSRKIAARPSPGDDRDDAERRRRGGDGARAGIGRARRAAVGASLVNAAARVSRTSRAWLSRFSTLIRLSAPTLSP